MLAAFQSRAWKELQKDPELQQPGLPMVPKVGRAGVVCSEEIPLENSGIGFEKRTTMEF